MFIRRGRGGGEELVDEAGRNRKSKTTIRYQYTISVDKGVPVVETKNEAYKGMKMLYSLNCASIVGEGVVRTCLLQLPLRTAGYRSLPMVVGPWRTQSLERTLLCRRRRFSVLY